MDRNPSNPLDGYDIQLAANKAAMNTPLTVYAVDIHKSIRVALDYLRQLVPPDGALDDQAVNFFNSSPEVCKDLRAALRKIQEPLGIIVLDDDGTLPSLD